VTGGGRGSAPSANPEEEVEGAATTLDVDALQRIVEILEESNVTRLSWRRGRERLFIRRGQPDAVQGAPAGPAGPAVALPAPPAPVAEVQPARQALAARAPAPEVPPANPGTLVTSPFVGTFYRTPAPDQPPFVEMGSVVRKGQVLCIIEAMKLMNEIEAEMSGKVTEILAENGQPVEYGQALFRLEPN